MLERNPLGIEDQTERMKRMISQRARKRQAGRRGGDGEEREQAEESGQRHTGRHVQRAGTRA